MELRNSCEFPLFSKFKDKPNINYFTRRQGKLFNNKRYLNNAELPSYLQLPSIFSCAKSKKNLYNLLPNEQQRSNEKIRIKDDQGEKNDMEIYNILKQNTPKQGKCIINTLEKNKLDSQFKINVNKKLEGGYLSNVNEYCITENYLVNQERLINLYRRPIKDFNVVNNEERIICPPSIKANKWGAFYDSYVFLAEKEGFKKRNGNFSDYLDQNYVNNSLQKSFSKGMRVKDIITTRTNNTESNISSQDFTQTPSSKFDKLARLNMYNESKKDIIKLNGIKFHHKMENIASYYAKKLLNSRNKDLNENENNINYKSQDIIKKKHLTKLEKVINGSLFFNNS